MTSFGVSHQLPQMGLRGIQLGNQNHDRLRQGSRSREEKQAATVAVPVLSVLLGTQVDGMLKSTRRLARRNPCNLIVFRAVEQSLCEAAS